jgi:hypothetical protein
MKKGPPDQLRRAFSFGVLLVFTSEPEDASEW